MATKSPSILRWLAFGPYIPSWVASTTAWLGFFAGRFWDESFSVILTGAVFAIIVMSSTDVESPKSASGETDGGE